MPAFIAEMWHYYQNCLAWCQISSQAQKNTLHASGRNSSLGAREQISPLIPDIRYCASGKQRGIWISNSWVGESATGRFSSFVYIAASGRALSGRFTRKREVFRFRRTLSIMYRSNYMPHSDSLSKLRHDVPSRAASAPCVFTSTLRTDAHLHDTAHQRTLFSRRCGKAVNLSELQ